jgi:hypothetical protein
VTQQLKKIRWAAARLVFIGYIGFSVLSLIGGFLTAPLMTWYFFGDWRFWRYWSAGLGLLPHALRLIRLMLSDNRSFMFSVPLTSPPRSSPDTQATVLHRFWPHGSSCGDCSNCCRPGGHACPLLDEERELCRGYDSFYWRYFNCGRFPSAASEIDYYDCRKWVLTEAEPLTVQPVMVSLSALTKELRDIRYEPSHRDTFRTAEQHVDDLMPEGDVVDLIGRPAQSKLRGSDTASRSGVAERR